MVKNRPPTFRFGGGKRTSIKVARRKDDYRPSSSQRLYNAAWRTARLTHLIANPWCVNCMRHGKQVCATVVDHIRPHRGDRELFFDPNNRQSLCKYCHDSWKQRIEKGGITQFDDDGYIIQ